MPNTPRYTAKTPLYTTYLQYFDQLRIPSDISFNRWNRLPENLKVAALYVRFYSEITFAWFKTKTEWAIEEEGVEEIIRVLAKNVSKIEESPSRYSEAYIYKISYNAFYCINIDHRPNWKIHQKEISETFSSSEGEDISWFERIGQYDKVSDTHMIEDIWKYLESLDAKYQIYIEHILDEISTHQACCRLKSIGEIQGKLSNKLYKELTIEVVKDQYSNALAELLGERYDPYVLQQLMDS